MIPCHLHLGTEQGGMKGVGVTSLTTPYLHVYSPDGEGEPIVRSRRAEEPEPIPLQYRMVERQAPEGPRVDAVLLWFNEDAARCRWCKPGDCTFSPTGAGVGTCVVQREGGLARVLPLPVPLPGTH
jgi:hypothetical protein